MAAPIEIQLRHTLPPTPVTKVVKLSQHLPQRPERLHMGRVGDRSEGIGLRRQLRQRRSYRTFASAAGRW